MNKKKFWIIGAVVAVVFATVTVSATLVAAGQWNRAETQPLSDGETDPVILLDDITPLELTEAVTTTVPPASTDKPTDAAPSGDTAKPTSAEKQTETAASVTPPATRQITVDGKKITLRFVEHKEAEKSQKHDRDVYRRADDDNIEFTIDSKTGQIISYFDYATSSRSDCLLIAAKDAVEIAKRFLNEIGYNISQYQFTDATVYDQNQYLVSYNRVVDGYKTAEGGSVGVSGNGTVIWFSGNPNAFAGIKVDDIHVDKEKVMQELEKKIQKSFRDGLQNYSVSNMWLATDTENRIVMKFDISINSSSNCLYRFEVLIN